MMQKEVADHISAQPNTKAYGSLSCGSITWLPRLPSSCLVQYVPAPNVDSAILKMVRRPEPAVAVEDELLL